MPRQNSDTRDAAEPSDDGPVRLTLLPNGRIGIAQSTPHNAPEMLEVVHGVVRDGLTYRATLGGSFQLQQSAPEYLQRYLQQMAPRNPVEQMLATQMLWQHARIGRLVELAERNLDSMEFLRGFSAAIDEGMNTYRRQALAWSELRSPKPLQIIKGQQVNMAEQQVVSNGPSAPTQPSGPIPANEQGSGAPHDVPALTQTTPSLQALGGGIGVAAGLRPPAEALGALNGSAHARRQGPLAPERPQARPPRCGCP